MKLPVGVSDLQASSSRRAFVTGAAGALWALSTAARGLPARRPPTEPPPWPHDADGDGRLGLIDRSIVEAALGRSRGWQIRPRSGWDPRADLLGAGRITGDHLDAWDRVAERAAGVALPPRPLVTCFHYGWYRGRRRRGGPTTVVYRNGPYASRDPRVEEDFHALKHEFGIDADLLSWIDRPDLPDAYERGYMGARNLALRRFGLLYETVIDLEARGRVRCAPPSDTGARMARSFSRMGAWVARMVEQRGARPLTIDDRPVIYVYASHLLGTTWEDVPWAGRVVRDAREAFAEAYGAPPWLIGDESPFPSDPDVSRDRRLRARWFDATTRYHHYEEAQARRLAADRGFRLDEAHRQRILDNEIRTVQAFRGLRNQFTEEPLLVIPSAAAGFAKRGLPTLRASGEEHRRLLIGLQGLVDAHLSHDHAGRLGTAALPAMPVLVGSWNEEFEGHALMPARHNEALADVGKEGFDWLAAIKSVYGSCPAGR